MEFNQRMVQYSGLVLFILFLCFLGLVSFALWKYIQSNNTRKHDPVLCRSLGEVLKTHRMKLNMTQEFVAERIGVSRQTVSKWESGKVEPSTTNLFALANLFELPPEQLMKEIQSH